MSKIAIWENMMSPLKGALHQQCEEGINRSVVRSVIQYVENPLLGILWNVESLYE